MLELVARLVQPLLALDDTGGAIGQLTNHGPPNEESNGGVAQSATAVHSMCRANIPTAAASTRTERRAVLCRLSTVRSFSGRRLPPAKAWRGGRVLARGDRLSGPKRRRAVRRASSRCADSPDGHEAQGTMDVRSRSLRTSPRHTPSPSAHRPTVATLHVHPLSDGDLAGVTVLTPRSGDGGGVEASHRSPPRGLHCCLRGRSWTSSPPTARSAPTEVLPRCAASPTRP